MELEDGTEYFVKHFEELKNKVANIKEISKYLPREPNFMASIDMLDHALTELSNREVDMKNPQIKMLNMTIKQLEMMADDLIGLCIEKITICA